MEIVKISDDEILLVERKETSISKERLLREKSFFENKIIEIEKLLKEF